MRVQAHAHTFPVDGGTQEEYRAELFLGSNDDGVFRMEAWGPDLADLAQEVVNRAYCHGGEYIELILNSQERRVLIATVLSGSGDVFRALTPEEGEEFRTLLCNTEPVFLGEDEPEEDPCQYCPMQEHEDISPR